MLYFILWTIAILFVVLSIPVAHFVEVSRRKKQLAGATAGETAESEASEVAEGDEDWNGEAPGGEPEPAAEVDEMEGFEAAGAAEGDDFSAFDESFEEEQK